MKTWRYLVLLPALVFSACGEDGNKMVTPSGDSGAVPPEEEPSTVKPDEMETPVDPGPEIVVMTPDGEADPMMDASEPDASVGEPDGSAPDAAPPPPPWYACQSSDQAFVRNALLAVLGRRPYSQAEVKAYTDLITQIDEIDGLTTADKIVPPGGKMRHSRKVLLESLFKLPEYATYWEEVYRDLIRVQRVDEMHINGCFVTPGVGTNPAAVATYIRSKPAYAPGADPIGPFTMHDVIKGSIGLDDVTPIYLANIFSMLTETYAGANAEPVALELTRRRDFGAWFDSVYLNRDVVCLGCHNSEFSVTQSDDPATNRHFPLPALLEESLFGLSTGPETFGGYEGGDRMHAVLRYKDFVNDCTTSTAQTATDSCPTTTEVVWRCMNGTRICDSTYQKRLARPWGWVQACGRYTEPRHVTSDIAGVEAKFGNLTGLRANPWDLDESLRNGFLKLRRSGLGATAEGEVADPDKAFAYLVSMSIVEKVWQQIVGTPLTIPTRFPRNAAARDQLASLVDTFVKSGYSNQKLIETILASPYANLPSPENGCGDAYALPAIFDPWVIADTDPIKKKNSVGDSVVSLPARTATTALYAALNWSLDSNLWFPDTSRNRTNALYIAERNFQTEVGFFLKNAEPGFRGFDFQARLGWEDRFGTCGKLPGKTANADFIDDLIAATREPNKGTVGDLVLALKDRMIGRPYIEPLKEKSALEALLGASLVADASTVTSDALRKVCGVIASSPQFLMIGLPAKDATLIPKLTPAKFGYAETCFKLEQTVSGDVEVICNDEDTLTVSGR